MLPVIALSLALSASAAAPAAPVELDELKCHQLFFQTVKRSHPSIPADELRLPDVHAALSFKEVRDAADEEQRQRKAKDVQPTIAASEAQVAGAASFLSPPLEAALGEYDARRGGFVVMGLTDVLLWGTRDAQMLLKAVPATIPGRPCEVWFAQRITQYFLPATPERAQQLSAERAKAPASGRLGRKVQVRFVFEPTRAAPTNLSLMLDTKVTRVQVLLGGRPIGETGPGETATVLDEGEFLADWGIQ
jgi:hypothetical protein